MATSPTSEEVVSLFESGNLADSLARQFDLRVPDEVMTVQRLCVGLHNEGKIDLLHLVEAEQLQALEGHDYFRAVHFFCQMLPDIIAAAPRMMSNVKKLILRGGSDMGVFEPHNALRAWCANNPTLAQEMISAARDGDPFAGETLSYALEAVNGISQARQIALEMTGVCRGAAMIALGSMRDEDPASQAETLAVFSQLSATDSTDLFRSQALHALSSILSRRTEPAPPEVIEIVRKLTAIGGESTIHGVAQMLARSPSALSSDLLETLFEVLRPLTAESAASVSMTDLALHRLLETDYAAEAIEFVTYQVTKPDSELSLRSFSNFTRTLVDRSPRQLSRAVVKWLLSGEPKLCEGLSEAMEGHGTEGQPIIIDPADLNIQPVGQVFICRKAIGWFFIKPVTAASILTSVLRVCTADVRPTIVELLVNPLLLSYGRVREYLLTLPDDDKAKLGIDEALAQIDAYHSALHTVPLIKELQPSEHRRRIESLRTADSMRIATKQARSQSVLLSLVKKSVLLYGSRSLSFIKDADGSLQSFEMDLKSFGVSIEMPGMHFVDPVGLDYQLRVFRRERLI